VLGAPRVETTRIEPEEAQEGARDRRRAYPLFNCLANLEADLSMEVFLLRTSGTTCLASRTPELLREDQPWLHRVSQVYCRPK
jgi:hypothetical protein